MNYGSDTSPLEVDTQAGSEEFLTFTLGSEEYAIDIIKVQEIRGYDAVTAIAHAPSFIKGVINLRGTIVPIVDLRIRFGLGRVEYSEFTVVVILSLEQRLVGVVVDSVSDVVELHQEQLKPVPEFSSQVGAAFIDGLASVGGQMLIVVDIERLMASPEMALTEEVAA